MSAAAATAMPMKGQMGSWLLDSEEPKPASVPRPAAPSAAAVGAAPVASPDVKPERREAFSSDSPDSAETFDLRAMASVVFLPPLPDSEIWPPEALSFLASSPLLVSPVEAPPTALHLA